MKVIIIKIITVIAVFVLIASVSFGIRCNILDEKIKKLSDIDSQKSAELEKMRIDACSVNNKRVDNDMKYLNLVFSEIFTFYNMTDFNNAKQSAVEYGLPDEVIYNLFNTYDFEQDLYAETMTKVACRYDSSDIYLLEEKDGNAFYIANIKINLVNYDASFNILLFITLSDGDDIDNKIKSAVYYQVK